MLHIEEVEKAGACLTAGRSACVYFRIVADTLTPVGAALRLLEAGRGDFLLESVEGSDTRGRYSLLGINPDLVFSAKGAHAHINRKWQVDRDAFEELQDSPLQALEALRQESRLEPPADLPQALASLVGYLGFEAAGQTESLPVPENDPLGLPDILFVRPSVLLVFDQLKDEAFGIAPIWTTEELSASQAEEMVHRACERLAGAYYAICGSQPAALSVATQYPALDRPYPAIASAVPAERYREMVGSAQEYIAAGDIFQVVLAQRFSAPFPLPAMALYRSLRRINPSPFLYLLDLPGFAVVGSSPEILVRVRQGEVTIRPIAGTRPRGSNPAIDAALEEELLADPKERAEHLMLLDLGRNDVGRVAEAGSVEVTASFTVERYSHVMHIVSNVTGKLANDVGGLQALLAGFPAGTVSGAPKVRACQIISELEDEARGPYAGAVGYFAPDGSVDSCIVLRTAVLKDDQMHVTAGAGIVSDSDPDAEQQECEAKAGALFAAAHDALRLAAGERVN